MLISPVLIIYLFNQQKWSNPIFEKYFIAKFIIYITQLFSSPCPPSQVLFKLIHYKNVKRVCHCDDFCTNSIYDRLI